MTPQKEMTSVTFGFSTVDRRFLERNAWLEGWSWEETGSETFPSILISLPASHFSTIVCTIVGVSFSKTHSCFFFDSCIMSDDTRSGGSLVPPILQRDTTDSDWPSPLDESVSDQASKPRSYVIKRNGEREPIKFDKITERIEKLAFGLNPDYVNAAAIAQRTIRDMPPNRVETTRLDMESSSVAVNLATRHPDNAILAGRIRASDHHKKLRRGHLMKMLQGKQNVEVLYPKDGFFTRAVGGSNFDRHMQKPATFLEVMTLLHGFYNNETETYSPIVTKEVLDVATKYASTIHAAMDYKRDFMFSVQGFETLRKSYLLRIDNVVVERPQDMWMRVAIGIHGDDIASVLETYELMSTGKATHATPTLFNAGTPKPQMSSCFLMEVNDDSINGIYSSLKEMANVSKYAGGIGIHIHKIRASGSFIAGTNGRSNGLVPMLHVWNATAVYVDQGGGKRKGSFAIYLEPWHADFLDFLTIREPKGTHYRRGRELNTAAWIPDLFMERVEADGNWTFFCPNSVQGLEDLWGETFKAKYLEYEADPKKVRKTMRARKVLQAIVTSFATNGQPYILFKDACNRKSNQQNLGTIKSSNLCTEIVEYSSPDEIAVCNLASIALKMCVKPLCDLSKDDDVPSKVYRVPDAVAKELSVPVESYFDLRELRRITCILVRNLNKIIDKNFYPLEKMKRSNFRHRPIGIGVQGLADAFMMLKLPYDSPEAKKLNTLIFETMYFSAVSTSVELAKRDGAYETFQGSPLSKGHFQFDLWQAEYAAFEKDRLRRLKNGMNQVHLSGLYDWEGLRQDVMKYGVRNSLLMAPMPTASTSTILGSYEGFEPISSNMFMRDLQAGSFKVINQYLVKDLIRLGLWTPDMKNAILEDKGSIQSIPNIPGDLKAIYRTSGEIDCASIIDMAADRGAFICQSQSMNLFMPKFDSKSMMRAIRYGWKRGLKTGMYYLRTQSKIDSQDVANQKTAETTKKHNNAASDTKEENEDADGPVCTMQDDCLMCGA